MSAALALPALVLLAGCQAISAPPAVTADQALLARGEYLVRIAGCNDCHTPNFPERAGDVPRREWLVGVPLGFVGPWGTTYAANLRLKLASMDEATWMQYSARLRTRPPMPDFNLRAMDAHDRRAIYRFIRALGPAGQAAPAYLPPGRMPPPPYLQLVLPPASPAAP
ncbi:cytochrome C [Thermomonas flagellata]|uniref:cytochrome C n=1 Tax=Thermomonas flagellata TaxID=2888524 RepID=UPI001F0468C0|nr:cytochrome C [Thermomonas flagellata]